jgi:hypothetical protein
MLPSSLPVESSKVDPLDQALSPLIELAERAVASKSRLPVLSLWKQLPILPLFAAHLHLRWAGEAKSLPLSPRIGIFPFLSSDFELLASPLYSVDRAQSVRQLARTERFSQGQGARGELYPDWEQAVDRRRHKLRQLTLPASSFISIDRINERGDARQGHRPVVGRFAPRGELRPQLLVPARGETTRELVRAFSGLDLVLVNVQNVRGRQLAASIAYFLQETPPTVPMLIVASSPADLVFTGALEAPSASPVILGNCNGALDLRVKIVNRDRALAERRFCAAVEDLTEKSEVMARLVSHAKRTWWATRQSISTDTPREATAFASLYADMLDRSPGCELELLEEAKRLILTEAEDTALRTQRRNSVVDAILREAKPGTILVLARSDGAAEELKLILARDLNIGVEELVTLGVAVCNVFGPWPIVSTDSCIACGYFGTTTIDMIFASGAQSGVLIVDPIEARVAIWDIERRFCSVRELPETVVHSFKNLSARLEAAAAPSATPISLPMFSADGTRPRSSVTSVSIYTGKPGYVCLCFTDGSTEQTTANSRFEVVGRRRLSLQSIAAKYLRVGDQVIVLNDDERAAFSERLLRAMDEGRFRNDKQRRTTWLTTLRAVRSANAISVPEIKERMEGLGVGVDASTIRTWLPRASSDECGVPDREDVFLGFAKALDIVIPTEVLSDWFTGINRLRINHRKIGRELVRAIRGAYLGRLDPVSVAKMEKEWGVEAKALLEAARVAVIDEVIPLDGELHD